MDIGNRIKAARIHRGLTQKQLGELCGMADSAIRRYESGRGNPTRKTLKRLADALHVTIPYFDGMDDLNAIDIDEALRRGDRHTAEKLMGMPEGTLNNPDPGYSYSDLEWRLIFSFSNLNETGQKEAVKRVEELSDLPRYRRPDVPLLLNIAGIDCDTLNDTQTTPQTPAATAEVKDTTPPENPSEEPRDQ